MKGSVKSFVRDHVFPADGERVEIKALMRDYRAWCAKENVTPLDASAFLDELEKLCRKLGIETKVGDDQRVYCLNVKVAPAVAGMTDAVHLRPAFTHEPADPQNQLAGAEGSGRECCAHTDRLLSGVLPTRSAR